MKYLVCGKWADEVGCYFIFYVFYTDYNNSSLNTTFSNNLKNSKELGQNYYFYANETADGYVIGYESRLTGDTTDNYLINFVQNAIEVYSYIEKKTYTLSKDTSYTPPAVYGNAKNAYIYIASVLSNFYNPSSLTINWCWFDAASETCYINASAANRVGGTLKKTYAIYKTSGGYSFFESSEEYTYSNVDVSELNKKLQSYVENNMY